MRKIALLLLLFVLLTPGLNAQIQHIVIAIQENHSFDNYFGRFRGVNGATSGRTSLGTTISLAAMSDQPQDCNHNWSTAKTDINNGNMNGFDKTCPKMGAYVQATSTTIPNYWAYARTYAIADRMFAQMRGPSFPTHAYFFAETSNKAVNNPTNNPNILLYGWGCDLAAVGGIVQSYDPAAKRYYSQPPCFSMATMGDLLDAHHVSWRVYSPQPTAKKQGYQWNLASYFNGIWNGPDRAKDVSNAQFCNDAQQGKLPQVSWLTPFNPDSEHPTASLRSGENWIVKNVNCLMSGPQWAHTLFILTWDEWGGFYDHVAPPAKGAFGYGIRVPLLTISPYSKPGYVSHVLLSFDSINKQIETTFGLPCFLTDCDPAVNDLSDMLTATALAPLKVLPLRTATAEAAPVVVDGVMTDDDD